MTTTEYIVYDYDTRGFKPTNERPAKGDRRDWYYATPPFLVHKGTAKVFTVHTVVGINRRGDELVTFDGGTYGRMYTHETNEGRRFTRTIIKAVKLLGFLGRKGAAARNKRERGDREAKARAGRDGECQICEGRQILHPTGANKGSLVLHGYERPGIGYAVGQCYGYHRKPFEVACDALTEWVEMLKDMREKLERDIEKAKVATEVLVKKEVYDFEKRAYKTTFVTLTPKDVSAWDASKDFEKQKAIRISNLESEARTVAYEERRQRERLANWKPAK